MTNLTAKQAVDLNNIDLNFFIRNFEDESIGRNVTYQGHNYPYSYTVMADGGYSIVFAGRNFNTDASGNISSGTVTAIFEYSENGLIWQATGISLAAKDIYAAAASLGDKDDTALLKKALSGADSFRLSSGNDVVHGFGGNDSLYGYGGDDRLAGDSGDDVIWAGLGADGSWGGSGKDRFVYKSPAEASGDTIHDFTRGDDTLDLAAMDANVTAAGNQAFKFIGAKAFSGHAGELRFAGHTVSGDVNGDGLADFSISTNLGKLTASDCIL